MAYSVLAVKGYMPDKLLKKLNFLREGKHGEGDFGAACQQTSAFAANALELNTKFNV